MKFIRHLLSHGLLLTFIIALVGAYYYRAIIFSEEVNAKINGGVNSALVALTLEPMKSEVLIEEEPTVPVCDTPTEIVVDDITADEEVTEVNSEVANEDVEVEIVTVEEPAAGDDTEQVIIEQEAEVSVQDSAEEIVADITETVVEEINVETVVEKAETTIEDTIHSIEPTEQKAIDEEVVTEIVAEVVIDEAPSTNEVPVDATTVMENLPVDPHFELLNQARFAHQIGNDFNAIELYRELIQSYPDDPNVYGELGNVYYSKGKWKQASQAYYEAAIRLHKIEKTAQINYLVRVIEGLDPETAKKLNEQLGR